MRGEGTSREYLPEGYPAAADYQVVSALAQSAAELCDGSFGNSYHVGVVHSKDSFYGEVEPQNSAVAKKLADNWDGYKACGCLTSEMECAAIFSVGLLRGARCGAVLTALWNVERSNAGLPDNITDDSSRAIQCVIGAVKKLIEQDKSQK